MVDGVFVPRERAGAGLVLDAVPDAAAVLIELTQGAARGRAGAVATRVGVVGVEGDLREDMRQDLKEDLRKDLREDL